jgi:hypothetical protein
MGWHSRAGKPIDNGRVMLRPLDLVEQVISHAGFSVGLCDGLCTIAAAPRAAKGLGAIADVV